MELSGIGVSAGVALGPALVVRRQAAPVMRLLLPPEAVEGEVRRLLAAVEMSRTQLQSIKARLHREGNAPHGYIFDAHLLMLDDPLVRDGALRRIREEHVNAEWALLGVSDELHALFSQLTDPYLRERSTDLDDVLGRVLLNLAGGADAPSLRKLPGSFVLVASDLSPSDAAELDWDRVLAVVTDQGSATYHTAILARSFGVPAVVGLKDATSRIRPGSALMVDGTRGLVVVSPSAAEVEGSRVTQERALAEERQFDSMRALPAMTQDGVYVSLRANVEFPEEAETAVKQGAQGIGLFRSEYLLGRTRTWPGEERQYEVYRALLEQLRPDPVTVRLWDLGPEDLAPGGPSSPNPALGERALRLLARNREPFRLQVRALLRAAMHGPLQMMVPFVSGPEDLDAALALVADARAELEHEGVAHRDVPVGLTIEVPSAAIVADLLAPRVAFLAVGTNDLVQYLLAVDRIDPRVSARFESLHPAVLRMVRQVVTAGTSAGIPVSVCGEMAADPRQAVLLLGLGVRELSLSPAAIPRVKAALRSVTLARAGEIACRCLGARRAAEVEAILHAELRPVETPIA